MASVFRNDVLRRARARRRLTQEEVAERIVLHGGRCSRWQYSRWENGHCPPSGLATIAAIQRVLGVSALALVDREER